MKARAVAGIVFCWCACCGVACAQDQAQETVCDHGEGRFEARLQSGAHVVVAAAKSGGFAARSCGATISWKDGDPVVAPSAGQVDIDVMGADVGLGAPVVAFQTRKTNRDWLASYEIYSLDKAPHLLRTITGGDSYRAADVNFDGRIAIRTADAGAIMGFDGLAYKDFDFAPAVLLRFEHRRLTDVSAEYPEQYDKEIAKVRAELDAQALEEFRKTDGTLANGALPTDQLMALRRTKARVLEIVFAYLYSGRDQEAWTELDRQWPPADAGRVKAAILAVRSKGIDAQVEGVAGPAHRHKPDTIVYDTPGTVPHGKPHGLTTVQRDDTAINLVPINTLVDFAPRPILLLRENLAKSAETLELTIDAAGKVRSARLEGSANDPELLEAARDWKFIPAYRGGRPVACRDLLEVSPEQ